MRSHDQERKTVFFLLCCGSFTISFNVAAIAAAIPSISFDLKLSELVVSKIISYYLIPYGVGALIYAPLSRVLTYKKLLSFSMAIYAVSSFYCSSINSMGQFYIGRILTGISGASVIPLGLMIIGQLFSREVRGRLVGIFFSCSFFASLTGIGVSGLADWRWLFSIPALLGGVTAVLFYLIDAPIINIKYEGNVNYIQSLKVKEIGCLFSYIFIISFLYHGVHKWFGVFLSKIYGLDKLGISIIFIIMAVCGAFGQVAGGIISDKSGRHVSWIAGVVILGLTTMLLSVNFPLYILSIILGLFSMGWTIGHNGVSTVLTDLPERYRMEMAGLNSSVRFIAGGLGFYISGFFVKKSFSLTFLIIGLLIFISIIHIFKYNNIIKHKKKYFDL